MGLVDGTLHLVLRPCGPEPTHPSSVRAYSNHGLKTLSSILWSGHVSAWAGGLGAGTAGTRPWLIQNDVLSALVALPDRPSAW